MPSGSKASAIPLPLFLRGHRPTWGDDEYAPQRWREASRSWLALNPDPAYGSQWLLLSPRERLAQPTPAELSQMLHRAQCTEEDLPALARGARVDFPHLFDRSWVIEHRQDIDNRERALRLANLDP